MARFATPDRRDPAIYPHWARETLRYCDTDAQGHISNVAFSAFCETGRTHFLLEPGQPITPPGTFMAIARLELDFLDEIHWPGEVRIGTGVARIGRSSFHLGQGVFVGERCVAVADAVMVLGDQQTRSSTPLPDDLQARLSARMIVGAGL